MDKAEALHDGRELYRVDCKVQTTLDHPMHWQTSCGVLAIWVYAPSVIDATARANLLVAVLPFELIGDEVQVNGDVRIRNEGEGIMEDMARMVGFAAFFDPQNLDADKATIPFPGEKAA